MENEKLNKIKNFLMQPGVLKYVITVVAICIFFISAYYFLLSPPRSYPSGEVVSILSGQSLSEISGLLKQNNLIRSRIVFQSAVIIFGGEKRVIAGDYLFDRPESPIILAYRFTFGKFGMSQAKITIPEGWNIFQIADYFSSTLLNFDKDKFLTLAKKEEGYLFPDTYFVSRSATPEEMIYIMKRNFDEKVSKLPQLKTVGHPLSDIIKMASIIEGEARTTENRKIVAGILWKRLSIGMPLQVDSTFVYINGKTSAELTLSDLKIKSPYNTYINKGLPPTPISNPGLDAIMSTLEPTASPYLYFLTSSDGTTMHYATTLTEHVRNKKKFLK